MAQEIRTVESLTKECIKGFEKRFNYKPTNGAQAPGRVNLIGEHTDYNGGFVFPMALPMVTVVIGSFTDTGICRVETLNSGTDDPKYTEFPIDDLKPGKPKWCNYVKGVAAQMPGKVQSFDAVIISSVPLGGGVSSSASLEVAMYTFLEQIVGVNSSDTDIEKILRCQKAEHEFAGMPCGIMDQYISMMGREGYALLLDCRSQTGKLIPLEDKSVVFLITNSNVKHELTGSEYPTRRKQCFEAAEKMKIETLREATMHDLESVSDTMDSETFRRVRHVITEIKRTEQAAVALEAGRYTEFGAHMVDSHNSLKNDYEVSCKELDMLVEFAMEMRDEGVYGSRMTGGGFGGCTVSLVKRDAVEKVISHINDKYSKAGYQATFFICPPSDGAKEIVVEDVYAAL